MTTLALRRAFLIVVSTAVVHLCCLHLWAAQPKQGEMRTWRDSSGRFAVEAKLLKTSATHVQLQTTDGRKIAVPIDRLSESDRTLCGAPHNVRNVKFRIMLSRGSFLLVFR